MQPVSRRLENRETSGTPGCYSADIKCRCAFSRARCGPPARSRHRIAVVKCAYTRRTGSGDAFVPCACISISSVGDAKASGKHRRPAVAIVCGNSFQARAAPPRMLSALRSVTCTFASLVCELRGNLRAIRSHCTKSLCFDPCTMRTCRLFLVLPALP